MPIPAPRFNNPNPHIDIQVNDIVRILDNNMGQGRIEVGMHFRVREIVGNHIKLGEPYNYWWEPRQLQVVVRTRPHTTDEIRHGERLAQQMVEQSQRLEAADLEERDENVVFRRNPFQRIEEKASPVINTELSEVHRI